MQTETLTVSFTPEIKTKLEHIATIENRPVSNQALYFILKGIENYKEEEYDEDYEDYVDALRICAMVDSGEMETYSKEEVWRELDEMDN